MNDERPFEPRPWGGYQILDAGDGYQVKRLTINPGGVISLQIHQHRSETWKVVQGVASVQIGSQQFAMDAGSPPVTIPKAGLHRAKNEGDVDLVIIEVQQGSIILEEDIVRYEDTYGRA